MHTRAAWIWWTVTASATVLVGVVLGLVLTGGGHPSAPDAAPAPAESATEEPDPEPPPPPPPGPVVGAVSQVEVADQSVTDSGLRPDGSDADAAVEVDQDATDAAVRAATQWVDAHLTSAHQGDGGQVPAELEGPTAAATTGLAHPDRPVTSVSYAVVVGVRGTPEWLRVDATVERADDSTGAATFVFVVVEDGVELLAIHPGSGTAPPERADPQGDDTDGEGTS